MPGLELSCHRHRSFPAFRDTLLKLEPVAEGTLNAVVFWFDLHLDNVETITSGRHDKSLRHGARMGVPEMAASALGGAGAEGSRTRWASQAQLLRPLFASAS